MSLKLIAAVFVASALGSPAFAAGPGSSQDDVQYGDVAARFADGAQHRAFEGADVVYPAARVALSPALPAATAVAQNDDVAYPAADAPAAPVAQRAGVDGTSPGAARLHQDARLACGCPQM